MPYRLCLLLMLLSYTVSGVQKRDAFVCFSQGNIGKWPVSVHLDMQNNRLTGYYWYEHKKQRLQLKGKAITPDSFIVFEHWKNKITGVFYLKLNLTFFVEDSSNACIKGYWQKTDQSNSLSVYLSLVHFKRNTYQTLYNQQKQSLKLLYHTSFDVYKVDPKNENTFNHAPYYKGYFCYPVLISGFSPGSLVKLNQHISDLTQGRHDTALVIVDKLAESDEWICDDNLKTEISFFENNIITLSRYGEGYCAGAAHPWHGHDVYTFDLNTGKQLTLGDILTPEAIQELQSEPIQNCSGDESEEALIEISQSTFIPETDDIGLGINSIDIVVPMYDTHASFPCKFTTVFLEKKMLQHEFLFLSDD